MTIAPKHITDLTDEELLKLLEDKKEDSNTLNISYKNDVMGFLVAYNIESGNQKIRVDHLYKLYKLWSKDPVSRFQFGMDIRSLLTNFNLSHVVITKTPLVLTSLIYKDRLDSKRNVASTPRYRKHIEAFISYYDLKKGSFKMPEETLYYLYDYWTYHYSKRNSVSEKKFQNLMNTYFTSIKYKGNLYFNIDESITKHISEEKIQEIQSSRKKKYAKEGKTKNKKKS